ncbi:cupin-like domain-containing protein [Seonamhaeicola sp.]|uniref:cupin-like domain-containing protein n=1 Tax=Seonamhaeicola sp. TaxID=1912245 RepID=UPI00261E3C43|nr:cupin-like domain-containing protein [Seonamhaeicola sp.]
MNKQYLLLNKNVLNFKDYCNHHFMDVLEHILSKSQPISETTDFDSGIFKKSYLNKKKPVLLKGYANNWNATKKWNLDFLSELEVKDDVILEIGSNNQSDTSFTHQKLKAFIESVKQNRHDNGKPPAYLTLFEIFRLFPHLKEDVDFSIFTKYTKVNDIYAWVGPKDTVTGFHYDTLNNLLAQVMGEKLVVLVSPKHNKKMYISKKYDLGAVSSEVDVNNFNEESYPNFKDVEFLSVVLKPGDVLFIPKKWWHYVKSVDTSISVNNFGALLSDIIFTKPKEIIKHSLHCRGYYRSKNNCTCHMVVDGEVINRF